MNAHIINCEEDQFLNQYRRNGYLGVGLVLNNNSAQALSNACRTTYSMYADMKTIFPGDMIFVHAGEYIYGVFKTETIFKEDFSVNQIFLSRNIYYYSNPNTPNSGWQNMANRNLPQQPLDYRQVAISSFVDNKGNNLCFEKGFVANEVFDLKRKGKVWSIPERWKYPDAARTVRPLTPLEAQEIIRLLERENSDTNNRLNITPKNLTNFVDIDLILNPNIVEDEKIIEAWICENLKIPALTNIFGNITSFGNNVQIGYLQGIDILGYVQGVDRVCKWKVIELRLGQLNFNDDIQNPKGYIKRTLSYMDWIIKHQANGDPKLVDGYIVSNDFDTECQDFVNNHNKVNFGRQLSFVKFDYVPPIYNTVNINKIA